MVAGFHLIWTAYGWWLPNDPRGSTSQDIRVEKIADLGELHHGRKAIQPPGREVRHFYDEARDVLKHPLLTLEDTDVELVGASFADVIAEHHYTCYACAIMADHVHVCIRKHRDRGETMIDHLRDTIREKLIAAGRRTCTHPVWTGGRGWIRFLNTREDFVRVIEYIKSNLVKAGRPEQSWEFIQVYDGWMPASY